MFETNKISGGIAALALLAGVGQATAGDAIPYPSVGTPNPIGYVFTATTTGDIIAYFAGSGASYDNELGLLVNGVSTGVIGLDDHTSAVGQSLDLGHVTAGQTLVFVLQNNTLGADAYSDSSLNVGYDTAGETLGHNHVYSTAYTATSPIIGTPGVIPPGTFVAFEDLPFPNSDFNYNDEDFVFTDVSTSTRTILDAASTLAMFSMGLTGIGMMRRRLSR
jgi:hypothetical protein